MCGIAGVAGRPATAWIDAMSRGIAHRGPDGEGRFVSRDGTVTLCHSRLAIQDLRPEGAQPMATVDGQVCIVFNGEIYNFRELGEELRARGHVFRSHSDTEVLLALYMEAGTAMLGRLNGIYAFAIWDERDQSLFVARDGMGVKPLYLSESGGCVSFASELKVLIELPWVDRAVDVQAVAQHLRHLWCPAPRTMLRGVRKLEPGEALVVRGGRVQRRWQHYRLPAPGPQAGRSASDWIEAVRTGLATAVRRQMVADVPVGAFLSGGLDSSAVVAHAREHASGRLQCFTIDFDAALAREEGFARDLPYAQRAARHLDVDLHVVTVGAEMADDLEAMVWQLDEPQADFAALNVLYISRLARQHGITVLLSGSGGDDLFTGYRRHRALMLEDWWNRVPAPLRRGLAGAAGHLPSRPPLLRRLGRVLSAGALEGDERLAGYFDWTSPENVRRLMAPSLQGAALELPLREALDTMPATATPLQRMLLLEQRFFLADHNLNYTDKMSMAVGVEARVPFLDRDLVELASRIPDRLRQHGSEGKWVLKKAMEGTLPHDVIYRPKTGFGVPLRAWLRGPLRARAHELLGRSAVVRRGLFDPAVTTRMLAEFDSGRGDHAYGLLSLMCIELWCRRYVDVCQTVAEEAA
jgi:asparagine synthase (glutamine-hydrolysing)